MWRSSRDLFGWLWTWFEPSVAFMPKGFRLFSLCIQKVSLVTWKSFALPVEGSLRMSSRTLICMSLTLWPLWAKYWPTLVGPCDFRWWGPSPVGAMFYIGDAFAISFGCNCLFDLHIVICKSWKWSDIYIVPQTWIHHSIVIIYHYISLDRWELKVKIMPYFT